MSKLNSKTSVGCLVKCAEDLVLVYEKQNATITWDIPAGAIESDETPEQAIRRELNEEIGLLADDNLRLVKIFWTSIDKIPTVHFLYEIVVDEITCQQLRSNTADIQKIERFTYTKIQKLIDTKAYEHNLAKARLQIFLNDPDIGTQHICLVD
jgi:8-oxo-dGTP pyrophosphatase MutT (NUDIX family)